MLVTRHDPCAGGGRTWNHRARSSSVTLSSSRQSHKLPGNETPPASNTPETMSLSTQTALPAKLLEGRLDPPVVELGPE